MAFLLQRSLGRSRGSRTLTLPMAWCQFYKDRIDQVSVLGSRCLIIAPRGLEDEAKRMLDAVEKDNIN